MESRYNKAINAAANLMEDGHIVFSPIVHGHNIDQALSESHAFWIKQCIGMLEKADALYVLMIDGWHTSKGIAQEIDYATMKGMKIFYLYS